MGSEGDWDEFVEALARDLVPAILRRMYDHHLSRIRSMRAPSEKLIYLYLILAEPQSFTGIRRSLGLAVKTVDTALRRLKTSGSVVQDDVYLYWVKSRNRNFP